MIWLTTFNVSLCLPPSSTPSMDVIHGLCPIAINIHVRDRKLRFMLPMVDRTAKWVFASVLLFRMARKNKQTLHPSLHLNITRLPSHGPRRTDEQSVDLLAKCRPTHLLVPFIRNRATGTLALRIVAWKAGGSISYNCEVGPDYASYYAFAPSKPFCAWSYASLPWARCAGFSPPIRDVNTATDA